MPERWYCSTDGYGDPAPRRVRAGIAFASPAALNREPIA
jgi:hypothetical protein